MNLAYIGTIILLILGFGFVVFWHELGHFIAAKWAGVKVEQFAIGFGHAICSWRKGLGFRWGSSNREYEQRLKNHILERREAESRIHEEADFTTVQYERAAQALGLGETEYRLNWLPLGGYVKMLGQDDLKPNAGVEDPRAYNNKPIGARMVVVSAGVIMNVILAAILFMALFLMGFRAPPALVGGVQIGSPAQQAVREDGTMAPLQVGDRILYFDNKYQHDFTKITLAVALAGHGQTLMYVERADGTRERLLVTPRPRQGDPSGILMLGLDMPRELKGHDPKLLTPEVAEELSKKAVRPGEIITAVQGQDVVVDVRDRYDYWKLDRALQESFGKPIEITVRTTDGREEKRTVQPTFDDTFDLFASPSFAGMVPRASAIVPSDSAAKDKLQTGDVIARITMRPHMDSEQHPTRGRLMELLHAAGQSDRSIDMVVIRDGKEVTVTELKASKKIDSPMGKRRGLGIALTMDVENPVIAEISPDSPAARAGLPRHATIVSIENQPVANWFDVHRILASVKSDTSLPIRVALPGGEQKDFTLSFTPADVQAIAAIRYSADLLLGDRIEPRQTNNPFEAAAWGVTDTRDLIIQFYLTLQRMVQGRVSPTNLMGPIGIVNAGSRIASKGTDWLLWFLAMISANLAVVNFLPIPIVDGGLFVFLILEKIMGRPLSPQAQSIAQIVGLALILSVFLFVTYQDITRIF